MILGIPSLMVARGGVQTADTSYWDTYVQVAGSNFTTGSATLGNITGLTFAAAINSLYEVEVILKCQSTSAFGFYFTVACSASGATGEVLVISHTTQGITTLNYENVQLGVENGVSKITTANTDGIAFLKAIVTTSGSTGNITVQCKLPAGGGTNTVYIGSVMKIRKIA